MAVPVWKFIEESVKRMPNNYWHHLLLYNSSCCLIIVPKETYVLETANRDKIPVYGILEKNSKLVHN